MDTNHKGRKPVTVTGGLRSHSAKIFPTVQEGGEAWKKATAICKERNDLC